MRTDRKFSLPAGIDPKWRIGIVHSSYYPELIQNLRTAARSMLEEADIKDIQEISAAGSFEIPLIGSALAKSGSVDALIGFGIIVEGETHHAELLAREVTRGIMDVQLAHHIPFAFEILYVKSLDQARERCLVSGGSGAEAAYAALHSLAQLHTIYRERKT